jgi:hypothetical protein
MKHGQREDIFIKMRIKRYYIVILEVLRRLLHDFNISTEGSCFKSIVLEPHFVKETCWD